MREDHWEASFSPECLSTYLTVAQGDREQALKIYTRNTELSAAFYGPLQGCQHSLQSDEFQTNGRPQGVWCPGRNPGPGRRCDGCRGVSGQVETKLDRVLDRVDVDAKSQDRGATSRENDQTKVR